MGPQDRMWRGALLPAFALFLATSFAGASATAADPASGTITATSPRVEWDGHYTQVAKGYGCSSSATGDPLEYCDRYRLTLDLPDGYWQTAEDGLLVQITWTDPADAFRLCGTPPGGTMGCDAGTGSTRTGIRSLFYPQARSGIYEIAVGYDAVTDSGYDGMASAHLANAQQPRFKPSVVFDRSTEVTFGPATIVSPHFLGTEPMMALERPQGPATSALDPNRVFVDWPLGSTSATGQLSRSEDGGDSFRLLFDRSCPHRNRPNCDTAGGGDTDVAVNPVNGHVYFTDLESLGNVAVASSTDHGDSFPPGRQHVISSVATAIDRQWVTGVPPGLVEVDHDKNPLTPKTGVEAFMSYEVGLLRKTIQGVDASGRPIPQENPQISDASGKHGPLRFDQVHQWLYQPAGATESNGRYGVASVRAANYQRTAGEQGGWQVSPVANRSGDIPLFSWLDVDAAGNAYTVWLQEPPTDGTDRGWRIHYSFSDITAPANDPRTGRPGTEWSAPVTVSLPEVGSAIFPQLVAGDAGRVAVGYMGTTDFTGDPQEAPSNTKWDVYTAVLTDALAADGSLEVVTGKVNHRTAHFGSICWGGAGCEAGVPEDPTGLAEGGDRSLADMMDMGLDAAGRIAVVFGDNNSSFAYINPQLKEKPFPHFAKQTAGPSLLQGVADLEVTPPTGTVGDPPGDATWPNSSDGMSLPTLDLTDAAVTLEGNDLVARVGLSDASAQLMAADLKSYAASYPTKPTRSRLQYVLRFLTDNEIYHLSMEHRDDGSQRFFGGKLDQNDRLTTSEAYGFVNGAGYHTDGIGVRGAIENGTLVLRAPAADLGLRAGSDLFSVTAFALAGPWEEDEATIENIMRTVDATPPFDQQLTVSSEATPAPTAVPAPDGDVFSVDLSPAEKKDHVGTVSSVIATLRDRDGHPVVGSIVEWHTEGVGRVAQADTISDDNGQARAFLVSDQPGDQVLTASAPDCASEGLCADSSIRHHGPRSCDVFGTMGSDVIWATPASEIICAFDDNDVVLGGAGNDVLLGGAGNDRLLGGKGRDRILGSGGADELRGGPGADHLVGGGGRDDLSGGAGRDTCRRGEQMRSCRM